MCLLMSNICIQQNLLHDACRAGDVDQIKRLIREGADVELKNKVSTTSVRVMPYSCVLMSLL